LTTSLQKLPLKWLPPSNKTVFITVALKRLPAHARSLFSDGAPIFYLVYVWNWLTKPCSDGAEAAPR
ncbi:MAG TPA: hypothetical protein VN214_09670, partial [Pseudomonas sp.]|nr:hypothetical protein [Pseudomonas sp.]